MDQEVLNDTLVEKYAGVLRAVGEMEPQKVMKILEEVKGIEDQVEEDDSLEFPSEDDTRAEVFERYPELERIWRMMEAAENRPDPEMN